MNRVNKLGMDLISYKQELLKDYPEIVRKSLMNSIEQIAAAQMIDTDTFGLLKDEAYTHSEFERYIKGHDKFQKNEEEILEEFKKLEARLIEIMKEREMDESLTTVIKSEAESILIFKAFVINEEFANAYFGFEKESDLMDAMKQRGFIEKFALLRLNAIFKPFVLAKINENPQVSIDISFLYFDREKKGYRIDILFSIKETAFDNETELFTYLDSVKEIVNEAQNLFDEKMIV